MTKPSDKPEFATDGGALIADPGVAKRHVGFVVDEAVPAHWLNWLLNNNSDWIEYLANLHGEAEFLNKSYQWTGSHGFKVSIGAFGAFVLGGTSNEVTYGDDQGVTTPRLRTKMIPLHNAVMKAGSDPWLFPGPQVLMRGGLTTLTAGDTALLSFDLPSGSKLTRVRVGIYDAHGAAFDVEVYQLRASLVPPYLNSATTLATKTQTFAAEGMFVLDTSASLTTDGALDVFQVAMTTHATTQNITFVEAQFLDPGPRNF